MQFILIQHFFQKYTRGLSQQPSLAVVIVLEHASTILDTEITSAGDCEKDKIRQIRKDARMQFEEVQSGWRIGRGTYGVIV